ncbi:hypothetical protein [Streptomyces sp. CA-132043]|uniref:hypothetical protein n=1 Tax=Streptomyces sp. CA-132043 TaxID=3240048 RepID=UPI003D938AFB
MNRSGEGEGDPPSGAHFVLRKFPEGEVMELVPVLPPNITDVMDEQARAWCDTPWRAVEAGLGDDGRYHGTYHVDMASDVGERAPHRPLLHASLLAELVNFHALLSITFVYATGRHSAFAKLPRVEPAEFRRRALLTGLQLSLKEPVFESRIPISYTLDEAFDKWERHRMIFFNGSAEAAGGKHVAKVEGCVNFRDPIDA